jgi:hypothetical protein
MKRTALLGALVVAVIACTFAVSTPRPAHAILCCDNYGAFATSRYWEMGASCQEAADKFRAAGMPEAQAICNPDYVCGVVLPPCYYDSMKGAWVVDGEMIFDCTYRCTIGPIDPIQP